MSPPPADVVKSRLARLTVVFFSLALGCITAIAGLQSTKRGSEQTWYEVPIRLTAELETQGIMSSLLAGDPCRYDTNEGIGRLLSVDPNVAWLMRSILYDGMCTWARHSRSQAPNDKNFTWELTIDPESQKEILQTINTRAEAYLTPDQQRLFDAMCVIELRQLLSASSILLRESDGRITMRLMPSKWEMVFGSRENRPHSLIVELLRIAKHERE